MTVKLLLLAKQNKQAKEVYLTIIIIIPQAWIGSESIAHKPAVDSEDCSEEAITAWGIIILF